MLERFDDGGVSDLMAKGVFIMDFGNFQFISCIKKKECQKYEKRLTCVSDLEYVSVCVKEFECRNKFVRVGVCKWV